MCYFKAPACRAANITPLCFTVDLILYQRLMPRIRLLLLFYHNASVTFHDAIRGATPLATCRVVFMLLQRITPIRRMPLHDAATFHFVYAVTSYYAAYS